MTKIMKLALRTSLLMSLPATFSPASAQSIAQNNPGVELRLSATTETVQSGDPIHLRAELENSGKEDFFAGSMLDPIINAPAYLTIEIGDEKGTKYRGDIMHSIFSQQAINEWWTKIAPGHYYGAKIELDDESYTFLKPVGKYTITARYVSNGGVTPPSPAWQVSSYRVWKGQVTSNPVVITVTTAKANRVANGADLKP